MSRWALAAAAAVSTIAVSVACEKPPPLPPPRVAEPGFAALRGYVGKYPRESGLWTTQPLADRLAALLGDRLPTLIANMEVEGPLTEDGGLLYVVGNREHRGGVDAAAVVIDPSADLLWVWLLVGGQPSEFGALAPGTSLPREVRLVLTVQHPPDVRG
ncbi:MAG TPA: hypothetical protein VJS92_00005 [Candidatus Polarisedimenticolaceae bacterium]|nr:hypothetical protein [Candidatus Polarisedimenticolaceae bacterium]